MSNARPLTTVFATAAAALVSLAVLASSAAAFHIPGATYTGTHSGGGAVILDVSPDGSAVTRFRMENYDGAFCSVNFVQQTGNIPIVNNSFSGGSSFLGISYSGSFHAVQAAQGTFTDSECESGTLTWTARTTASPAGSAECVAAQAPVSAAGAQVAAAKSQVASANGALRRAVRQVKKALKRAATPSAKRKARKQLRAANRRRARASRQLSQAKAERTQAEAGLRQAQAARAAVCEPSA